MPATTTLIAFAAVTAAVVAVPGPSVAYVVARSLEHGRAGGLVSMLGLETGALLHVVGAAAGLAALLASSGAAFAVVRYAGTGYLLYLGWRQLRGRRTAGGRPAGRRGTPSTARLYVDGVLVDLLNPKTALFFVAFLPQFIEPGRGPAATQVFVLGLVFVALAALFDGTYAVAAAALASRVGPSSNARGRIDMTTGCVYVSLAGITLLS